MTTTTVPGVTVLTAGHRTGSLATVAVSDTALSLTFDSGDPELALPLADVAKVGRNGPTMMTIVGRDGTTPKRLTLYTYDRGAERHGRPILDTATASRHADEIVAALASYGVATELPGTKGHVVGWLLAALVLAVFVVPAIVTGSAVNGVIPAVVVAAVIGALASVRRRRPSR